MIEAKVQSLGKSSTNLKRELSDCREELSYAKIRVDTEVKDRIYQKFLACIIKESVAKSHIAYMEHTFSKEWLPLPDPNEDSDSEKEDSTAPLEEATKKPFAWAKLSNVAPSYSMPPSSSVAKTAEADVFDSEKTVWSTLSLSISLLVLFFSFLFLFLRSFSLSFVLLSTFNKSCSLIFYLFVRISLECSKCSKYWCGLDCPCLICLVNSEKRRKG